MWEESTPKTIENLYTITALSWKADGSKICCGTLCGGVELFDCSLRRQLYRNRFEITYVGLSQAIIKDLSDGKRMVLKSNYGYEIDDVKILGDSRYIVAHTQSTLLLGDIHTARLSEIQWQGSGNEKFSFDNQNVCVIFNAGELSLVEYGAEEPLESVRTEHMNPHLISARICERKSTKKTLAFLLDPKTIAVNDLVERVNQANIVHDSRIDWLELNETASKLLFRDKRLRLYAYDLETEERVSLLSYCSYAQWVPGSDVVVAQNRNQLSVWYNINDVDRVNHISVKGDVSGIERKEHRTEIMVQEGTTATPYRLDEELIEFGTAIDDGDLNRALSYLESLPTSHVGAEAMWSKLAKYAIDENQLAIAIRCYGQIGDIAKVRYLQKIEWISFVHHEETGEGKMTSLKARAMLAQLKGDLIIAEQLYMESNDFDAAVEMYTSINRWEEAIRLTERTNSEMVPHMRQRYLTWLSETKQLGVAAGFVEKEGDLHKAIDYYLEAGLPGRAAKIMLRNPVSKITI